MKNCTILIPEPIPLGLTFLLAIDLAIVSASFVNKPSSGNVDTVFTLWLQRLSLPFLCDPDFVLCFRVGIFVFRFLGGFRRCQRSANAVPTWLRALASLSGGSGGPRGGRLATATLFQTLTQGVHQIHDRHLFLLRGRDHFLAGNLGLDRFFELLRVSVFVLLL